MFVIKESKSGAIFYIRFVRIFVLQLLTLMDCVINVKLALCTDGYWCMKQDLIRFFIVQGSYLRFWFCYFFSNFRMLKCMQDQLSGSRWLLTSLMT